LVKKKEESYQLSVIKLIDINVHTYIHTTYIHTYFHNYNLTIHYTHPS